MRPWTGHSAPQKWPDRQRLSFLAAYPLAPKNWQPPPALVQLQAWQLCCARQASQQAPAAAVTVALAARPWRQTSNDGVSRRAGGAVLQGCSEGWDTDYLRSEQLCAELPSPAEGRGWAGGKQATRRKATSRRGGGGGAPVRQSSEGTLRRCGLTCTTAAGPYPTPARPAHPAMLYRLSESATQGSQ